MRTNFISKAKSFHKEAMEAAHSLAEEKEHTISLNWKHFDQDVFKTQVRVFLCQKYNFSANNSEELVNQYLNCVQAENSL